MSRVLGRRESARSVGRSRRVGVGAGSRNERFVSPRRRGAHPPRYFWRKLWNRADRRLRGWRPRRIAPESQNVNACRPRWRHRTSRPPHRKVKAHSLFLLGIRRHEPLREDVLVARPKHRPRQLAASRYPILLSITQCLRLAATGTVM